MEAHRGVVQVPSINASMMDLLCVSFHQLLPSSSFLFFSYLLLFFSSFSFFHFLSIISVLTSSPSRLSRLSRPLRPLRPLRPFLPFLAFFQESFASLPRRRIFQSGCLICNSSAAIFIYYFPPSPHSNGITEDSSRIPKYFSCQFLRDARGMLEGCLRDA